ncbi:MAG TPA: tetratricopeptide repeat protein [Blastocatellia bacterium]|nr:tetratricopeptide repeat protein [Blastocatellia bacterium]
MRLRLKPLLTLIYDPSRGMAEVAAAAPYVFGAVLALVATFLYGDILSRDLMRGFAAMNNSSQPRGPLWPLVFITFRFASRLAATASPVFFLIVIFVPACVFAANLVERHGSFLVRLRQDYAPLVSCALYGWALAQLLMIAPALMVYRAGGPNPQMTEAVLRQFAPLPYFLFLMVFAVRAALRFGVGRAVGAVALGACSLVGLAFVSSALLRLLTSPFLLIIFILLLRNFFGDLIGAQRAREEFRRHLEIATLNPADASAHYNLGLIHQQRGELDEARRRFSRAVEIDPDEVDAHYQLGRISREQGRLSEAIRHFDAVVRRDEDYSQSEVWREIGRTYFEAGQVEDARAAFERFLARRPSDAEGHYRYGLTLSALGRQDEAAAEMRACIEAARTSPTYKYRADKRWMSEADAFLRARAAGR